MSEPRVDADDGGPRQPWLRRRNGVAVLESEATKEVVANYVVQDGQVKNNEHENACETCS